MKRPPDAQRPASLALMLDEVVANLDAYDILRGVFDQDAIQRDLEAVADVLRDRPTYDASLYAAAFGVRA